MCARFNVCYIQCVIYSASDKFNVVYSMCDIFNIDSMCDVFKVCDVKIQCVTYSILIQRVI